jgi:hypothetical protein
MPMFVKLEVTSAYEVNRNNIKECLEDFCDIVFRKTFRSKCTISCFTYFFNTNGTANLFSDRNVLYLY